MIGWEGGGEGGWEGVRRVVGGGGNGGAGGWAEWEGTNRGGVPSSHLSRLGES